MMMTEPIEAFPAKKLLTPVKGTNTDFFYADYTLNLYRGCNHGCVYCDSRSVCYHINDFDRVRVKRDCLTMLEAELKQKKRAGVVGMGAASDPYNHYEQTLSATRGALMLLRRYGFSVGIPTKSDLMARDADVLCDIARQAPVRLCFSITTADDALAALLEPGAPSPTRRFAAMRALADKGLFVGAWLNPMLPFLTDDEEGMLRVLTKTAEARGRFCVCFFELTLREGDREYFYQALDCHPRFQGIKQKYVDAFGLDYICPTPKADALFPVYKAACEKLGLLWRFEDINREARSRLPSQLSLF